MSLRPLLLALLLPAALAVGPRASDAQLAELRPGARVRVRAPSVLAGRPEAYIAARSGDSLTLVVPNQSPYVVPLAAITSAEVSRGKSRSRGAIKGVIWGGGIGVALGLFSLGSEEEDCQVDCVREEPGVWMVTSLGSGVLLGAVIGAFVGAERWERLHLTPQVAADPARRTWRVGVTRSF